MLLPAQHRRDTYDTSRPVTFLLLFPKSLLLLHSAFLLLPSQRRHRTSVSRSARPQIKNSVKSERPTSKPAHAKSGFVGKTITSTFSIEMAKFQNPKFALAVLVPSTKSKRLSTASLAKLSKTTKMAEILLSAFLLLPSSRSQLALRQGPFGTKAAAKRQQGLAQGFNLVSTRFQPWERNVFRQ